jgi:hypothetical protein
MPKSISFAWPRFVMKTLAGLMSRWIMPWPCAASVGQRQRAPGEAMLERLALEILHDEVRLPVRLPDVVHGADVRVVERGRCPRLARKAFTGGRVGCLAAEQDLDRHRPLQPQVGRAKHFTHPAGAEPCVDLVRPEARARLDFHRRMEWSIVVKRTALPAR